MELSPDDIIILEVGPFIINATLVYTWVVMAILVGVSIAAAHRVTDEGSPGTFQNIIEAVVGTIRKQIGEITDKDPTPYIPFIGTIYLLIAISNLLAALPFYHPPTSSLSTTTALAGSVFLAVPVYAIYRRGPLAYLKYYAEPSPIMIPFNIVGELSRTLALAVRLFGNVMSGGLLVAILVSLTPLFFPLLMKMLELLIGQVQAYIFAVLATVYIASAAEVEDQKNYENAGKT